MVSIRPSSVFNRIWRESISIDWTTAEVSNVSVREAGSGGVEQAAKVATIAHATNDFSLFIRLVPLCFQPRQPIGVASCQPPNYGDFLSHHWRIAVVPVKAAIILRNGAGLYMIANQRNSLLDRLCLAVSVAC
jgi:hypothetical protein